MFYVRTGLLIMIKDGLQGEKMNTFQYEVVSIDGDYANLRRIDAEDDETKLVARALLPPEIMEGTKLLYEMLQYKIIKE